MPEDQPYLGDYFGHGPMHETFRMTVYTLRGNETFDVYGYHIEKGYLLMYVASKADNDSVRLHPQAVFVPGGWIGYATSDDAPAESMPVGFRPTPTAS